jgi:hypothetical protein
MINYKQCLLKRNNNITQTAWIPENFAIIGKNIKVKDNKIWKEWQVIEVYNGFKTEEQVNLSENVDREFKVTLG